MNEKDKEYLQINWMRLKKIKRDILMMTLAQSIIHKPILLVLMSNPNATSFILYYNTFLLSCQVKYLILI